MENYFKRRENCESQENCEKRKEKKLEKGIYKL